MSDYLKKLCRRINGRIYRRKDAGAELPDGTTNVFAAVEAVPDDDGDYGLLLLDFSEGNQYEPFWVSLDEWEDDYEEVKLKPSLKCESFGCKKLARMVRVSEHGERCCPEHYYASLCILCDRCSAGVLWEWSHKAEDEDGHPIRVCKACHREYEAERELEEAALADAAENPIDLDADS